MILSGTTPRALGWRGALGLLALAAVLLPALPAWALDDKKDEAKDIRFVLRLIDNDNTDPAVAALDEKIAKLKAELAEKQTAAARVLYMKKLAEADKAVGDARILKDETKNDQVIRVLADADRAIAARFAEDARAKIVTARWAARASGAGKVLLLQRDGKTILELPAEMVVAERDGKLILEIPLSAIRNRSTTSSTTSSGSSGSTTTSGTSGRMSGSTTSSGTSKTPASEQRIATLEKQLGDLMNELESIRRESRKNP